MDFRFATEEEQFRGEVRQFLKEALPPDWEEGRHDSVKAAPAVQRFQDKIRKKGWHMLAWPKEWGGQGKSVMEQLIYNEEMTLHHAPPGTAQSLGWVGPLIMMYGTEEQKNEHMPKLIRGEENWCTLYSEPNAGSDLAGLQTRAILDGDYFVVNGQKIWTSGAHRAHWGLLACRTDPDAPKHRGISMVLVPMNTPGITVRPLITMENGHSFNQVFFDNVKVPRGNLLGKLHGGWRQMNVGLNFERSNSSHVWGMKRRVQNLVSYATSTVRNGHPLAEDSKVRQKVADVAIRTQVAKNFSLRVAWMQHTNKTITSEASIDKVFVSELEQYSSRIGVEIMGLYGQIETDDPPRRSFGDNIEYNYLWDVAFTISRGTSEIQRNLIATRGLGLPRSETGES
jgi:alkylation response protein AidB-like acyl-CoA dehydrogenase